MRHEVRHEGRHEMRHETRHEMRHEGRHEVRHEGRHEMRHEGRLAQRRSRSEGGSLATPLRFIVDSEVRGTFAKLIGHFKA